jgi:aminoglycoside phosphotransferase (APT) family kinase protein
VGQSQNWKDQATEVRIGEELNREDLLAYLEKSAPDFSWEGMEIKQFPSGYSNLTYELKTPEKSYVLRRPPFGSKVASAHDMSREFRILKMLEGHYSKAPRPVLLSGGEDNPLEAPFFIMEKMEGVILRPKMPKEMCPNPDLMRRIADSSVDALAELHKVDVGKLDREHMANPQGYVQRQIEGWTKRYWNSKVEEQPEVEKAGKWLAENMPAQRDRIGLIHNDFKYDNIVLNVDDWSKIIGLLDWEMSTIGDPLMDLGTSLAYWIHPGDPEMMKQMAVSPTTLEGNPSREEVVQRYAQQTGDDPGNAVFYYAYGLFKLAVVVQQIYYRYKKGLTQDKRFAQLGMVARGCGMNACLAIEKQRIDNLF